MPDVKKPSRAADLKEMYAEDEVNQMLESTTPPASLAPKKKGGGGKVFLTIILILVVVFVALLVISKVTNWDILGVKNWKWLNFNSATPAGQEVVKASNWQAVFLSNGQVYFGKLDKVNDNYPSLEDIYYLQVQNVPIQPAEPATEEAGVQPAVETQEQLILVKFGTELHRPMDKMYINKDHILFFEDLAADSNVVVAIENYKAGRQEAPVL